jgi:hemolysin activation/secretion protein
MRHEKLFEITSEASMNVHPPFAPRRVPFALLPLALVAFGHGAFAQQPPSAGSQLQQIPAAPAAPRAAPEIRIQPSAATPSAAADQARIVVKSVHVTGSSLFTEADLIALTGFVAGNQYSLADLQGMAAKITQRYRDAGYFVAQAYVPAQEIKDNSVTIAVSEGRYGAVTLRNQSNLSDSVARRSLAGIDSGAPIVMVPLEERLLLLSDVPGVVVSSTLVPGAAPGTSDLIVDVAPGRRVSGSVDADNAGNRYTGEYRIGATVNLNDPLGLGDVASLRLLTSGSGLKYGRAAYQVPVGRAEVGVAYSWLDYSLGREFESLQAHGTAQVASAYARYPLLRSRNNSVYAQLEFDAKKFHDQVDSTSSVTDKRSRVLMSSILGDHRDTWGGGGADSYAFTWTSGHLDIETASARAADALAARTNGHFDKLSFSAMRLQSLGGPFSLYAAVSGQLASKNLDVSEKMELGGMNGVRAYPEGETYADQGVLATLEARYDVPRFDAARGQLQLVAFVDTGSVTINKNPWAAGENHRTLSGAGVGANWGEANNFLVRAYYARKLGSGHAVSAPDKSGRFWIQLVKYF